MQPDWHVTFRDMGSAGFDPHRSYQESPGQWEPQLQPQLRVPPQPLETVPQRPPQVLGTHTATHVVPEQVYPLAQSPSPEQVVPQTGTG